nr:DNA binding protein [Microvirus sp.]
MKYPMYAICDAKTGYMPPTIDYNDASAVRNFEHAVKAPDSLMGSHPSDYSLRRVAEYDTDSGVITPEASPVVLVEAASFLR